MSAHSAVAIGFFDGVHLGHQALLAAAAQQARGAGDRCVALTFDRTAREVLGGGGPVPTIDTLDERISRLQAHGADQVEVIEFTPEFAALSGESFVAQTLAGRLDARHVVVGHDFHFGRQRSCDSGDLERLGQRYGFGATVVPPVLLDGRRISSGAVRSALLEGRVEEAARLLGRAPELAGPVVRGQQLGRELGFPTINLSLSERKLLPARGIYVARCWCGPAQEWPAVVSVGVRPTVTSTEQATVEAHLLDFAGDLYGQPARLALHARLRDEKRFESLDQLRAAIEGDVNRARRVLRV